MPCDCCDHPGEHIPRPPITHAEYREKYKHITASPVEFLRNLQSRLHPDLDNLAVLHRDHDVLWTLNEFLLSWLTVYPVDEEFEEHRHGVEAFIEHGLVDTLTKFICSEEFWTFTTSMVPAGISYRWLQMFSWILYDVAYILCHPTGVRNLNVSSESLIALRSYPITFQQDLANMLSKMWQYRHDLIRANPEDGSIVHSPILNRPLADSTVNFIMTIQLRNGFLSGPRFSREAGPLMLWCWAKSEYEADRNETKLLSMWLSDVNVDGAGKRIPAIGLPLLLADHNATRDVVAMCSWSLKTKQAPGPLVGLHLMDIMIFAGQVANWCDESTFVAVCHLWPQLVERLARACERQLCSGPKEYHHQTLSHAISSMYRPFCRNSINLFTGSYDIAHLDLVPLLAQHSAYSVEHSSVDVDLIAGILESYAIGLFTIRNVRCYKALTSDVVRRRIADVVVAVNQVSATTLVVKLSKKKMLEAWKKYESHLGDWPPVRLQSANVSRLTVGKTCAYKTCICSTRRRPAHKFHVCKGCWQVYYCNPECQEADWLDGHSTRCKVLRG